MDHLTALALRAKAGDDSALETFIAATRADVQRLSRYLGAPTDPQDLTQETYERALRSLHRFRGEGPAKAWLMSIARRVCVDATRANIRRRGLVERQETLERAQSHHDHSWLEIDELLRRLDDDRREAFVLTQIVGMSYQEAAMTVGCPIGTIRSRVARARSDLIASPGIAQAFGA